MYKLEQSIVIFTKSFWQIDSLVKRAHAKTLNRNLWVHYENTSDQYSSTFADS